MQRADIVGLAENVVGPVLLAGDRGYPAECATFNLLTPVRPAVAVGATSVTDVQAAVRFAAERSLPLAVLTTGHQVARPADGAVLVNMSRLNRVRIDAAQRLARVEGGALGGEMVDAAGRYGLAPITGASATVGVVGFTLGGGHSPVLGRTYGYAADHVQAVELVTADGKLRRVTAVEEPDLFWALRGGKGNFGVITALELSLFPVSRFYGGGLFFSGEHARTVLHAWREWVTGLPREMTSSIAFLRRPGQPFTLHVRFSSLGPREEAERTLAPIRRLAPLVGDTIDELPYASAATLHLDPAQPVPMTEGATALRVFPREAADTLLTAVGPESDTRLGFLELRAFGGVLEQPPAVANAVAGRTARWAVIAAGGGAPGLSPLFRKELTALAESLAPWAQDEMNVNLLATRGVTLQQVRAAYGQHRYDRLASIKQQYDPHNLFRMNHNIAPA
ncbi:FAD-binding oxidoreductase [Streptomyces sp. NPDC047841]|uniref:FAD-binding oxidoreductase n=1 Tax=Streptomyces sp. NPDC047841 TaxID=3154708 RepID=UPI0034545DD4